MGFTKFEVQNLGQGDQTATQTPGGSPNAAALLVGALYQLAADPREWAVFIDSLGVRPDAGAPDPATLAAIAAGSAEVARIAAGADRANAIDPASTAPRVAVLLMSRDGKRIAVDAAANAGPLGRLARALQQPEDASEDDACAHNRETLRAARARVASGDDGPSLVRLEIAGEPHPLFAYALAAERLPEALRRGVDIGESSSRSVAGPGGDLAIVAHVAAGPAVAGGLADAFGLTPAEVRLALALCEGGSLRGFADQQGLSVNTARNQLTAIFEKVGVNRQSELVRALSDLGQVWTQVEGRRPLDPPASGAEPSIGTVRLPDGRNLAYRTYGPADGRKVLLFHGGIGASLLPPGAEAACHDFGLRIIAPERAGVGHSDGMASHSLEATAQDMAAFSGELGLSPAQFLAINSGGQAALATAALMPDAVSRILMLSPRPPSEAHARSPNRMVVLQKRLQEHPWMAEAYFAIVKHRFARPLMRQIMIASAVSRGDAAFLAEHPQIVDTIASGIQAALARGPQGTAAEITTPPSKAALAALGRTAPVTVWLGAEDDYATAVDVADWLGDRIETLTVIDGIGHYLALKHWTDALAWLSGANRG